MAPDRPIYAEMALRNIHATACDKGMESLAESVQALEEECCDLLDLSLSEYSRSLSAWLYHREVFDTALRYFDLDHQSW